MPFNEQLNACNRSITDNPEVINYSQKKLTPSESHHLVVPSLLSNSNLVWTNKGRLRSGLSAGVTPLNKLTTTPGAIYPESYTSSSFSTHQTFKLSI
jgi:hypothetical protein